MMRTRSLRTMICTGSSRRRFLFAGAALLVGCTDLGPSNAPPTADFAVACVALTCQLTNNSTDPDGTIGAYSWNFGDGWASTEINPVHTYSGSGGVFTIRLTVTDAHGDRATTAKPVTVARGNAGPGAMFTVACINLTCQFTDRSTDPDAADSVVSRAWDFGDGTTSAAANPLHTYAAPGVFAVTLAVTDSHGAAATRTTPIDASVSGVSVTYERETPHSVAGRRSYYVLHPDRTFALLDAMGADTTIYTGRWTSMEGWTGVTLLDFDGHDENSFCGLEGVAVRLLDGHLGISYCGAMWRAGLEEGVYSSAPLPNTPGPSPSQTGQIAFVRNGQIHVANTDGSNVVQLSAGPNDHSPSWSPDGARIAFTRRNGATTAVFTMDADGGSVVQRAGAATDPTWSPDGKWLAFLCAAGMCKVRADTTVMPPDTVFQAIGVYRDPAWSPDGTRIAFMSDWAMYDIWFDIWVVAPDGSGRTALTAFTSEAPFESHQPAWSPDGQRIALVNCPWAFFYCSSSAITVMNADGSGALRLVAATGLARPTWSPDGQIIAYASANAIEWVSADGLQRGRIIANGHSPAWRP